MVEIFVFKQRHGRGCLEEDLNLDTNSPEKCIASAALPPFPQTINLLLESNVFLSLLYNFGRVFIKTSLLLFKASMCSFSFLKMKLFDRAIWH